MSQPVEFGPYSSVAGLVGQAPAWVPPKDVARIQSYAVNEQIYWSHVGAIKVMNRGLDSDDTPVYVPSSRIVIDTMNRYVGADLSVGVDPETGTPEQQLLAQQTFAALFARERFVSKYNANKRRGLMKGDWCWHVIADPNKDEGKRISLNIVRPEAYFPTFEDELIEGGDPDKLVQVRIVDLVQVGDEQQARVQLYDRTVDEVGTIYSSIELWKIEEWFDPEKSPLSTLSPAAPLPAGITAFPVYHVPNGDDTENAPWGSSELRGLEVLQQALNQSVTDEDLALALMGLGVYATDQAGRPVNAAGEQSDWFIYPGAVIENSKGLRRVEGITSVAPYTDHVARIEGYLADASGATDAARGRLEVSEAESGIALQIRFSPTLAKAKEKDQVILDVLGQMFYDLTQMWFPTFEGINFTDVTVIPTFGDKLPVNRQAEAELVSGLVVANIMSAASARNYLTKKGFSDMFDVSEGDLVVAEKHALAEAEGGTDVQAARETEEVDPNA